MLGQAETTQQKAQVFFDTILKIDYDIIDEEDALDTYLAFKHILQNESIEIPTEFKGYKLPPRNNLLKIRLQHFIELVNCDIQPEKFIGLEVSTACFYRKDWNKEYDEDELIDFATKLNGMPLYYSLFGVALFQQLILTLKETYPILYQSPKDVDGNEVQESEEGRKLYDMLNGLAGDDVTKWGAARNLTLETAFTFLEQKKIESEKKRLNLQLKK